MSLDKYFPNLYSEQNLLSCLLDPRFKSLPFALKEVDCAHKALIEEYSIYAGINESPLSEQIPSKEIQKQLSLFGEELKIPNHKFSSKQEIYNYMKEEVPLLTDPLGWWKINSQIYPILAILATKYLGLPATAVPCERIWSDAGNIVTKKRARLDPDTVCMQVVCHHNLKECKRLGNQFIWK